MTEENEHPHVASLEAADALGREGAKAQRIDIDFIKSQIDHHWWTTGDRCIPERSKILAHEPLKRLTLCFMVMKSGFIVVGKSVPLNAVNFDAEKGRVFSYEDCIRQLWPMFAFHWLQKQ